MVRVVAIIGVVAALLLFTVGVRVWHFNECRHVGYSTLYCITGG